MISELSVALCSLTSLYSDEAIKNWKPAAISLDIFLVGTRKYLVQAPERCDETIDLSYVKGKIHWGQSRF